MRARRPSRATSSAGPPRLPPRRRTRRRRRRRRRRLLGRGAAAAAGGATTTTIRLRHRRSRSSRSRLLGRTDGPPPRRRRRRRPTGRPGRRRRRRRNRAGTCTRWGGSKIHLVTMDVVFLGTVSSSQTPLAELGKNILRNPPRPVDASSAPEEAVTVEGDGEATSSTCFAATCPGSSYPWSVLLNLRPPHTPTHAYPPLLRAFFSALHCFTSHSWPGCAWVSGPPAVLPLNNSMFTSKSPFTSLKAFIGPAVLGRGESAPREGRALARSHAGRARSLSLD